MKNKKKPSAGITGAKTGGKTIQIVGFGCGDDTPARSQGDEPAHGAARRGRHGRPAVGRRGDRSRQLRQARPTKTVIIGTAGLRIRPSGPAPNFFRFNGDGAQWNAGLGDIVYKKLGWRTAAVVMDDYSFGWTSAAGFIADFCAMGGKVTKRVFPPLNTTDYSSYARQLPPPGQVDGYFGVVGGTGPGLRSRRSSRRTARSSPRALGEPLPWFLTGFQDVAPRLVGSYVGGFGTAPGLKTRRRTPTTSSRRRRPRVHRRQLRRRFLYSYYQTKALVDGLNASRRHRREAPEGAAEDPLGAVQHLEQRERQAGREPAGDPGPLAGADVQEANGLAVTLTATCRTSTRRSAELSRRRARRPAARSRPV